jgi:hypothetical protein
MIAGPTGDVRLDANFAWLRETVASYLSGHPHTIDEFVFKFDYKRHFPKEDMEAIEEIVVQNLDKDMETLERRFGGRRSGVSGGFATPTPCLLLGKKEDYENPKTDEG